MSTAKNDIKRLRGHAGELLIEARIQNSPHRKVDPISRKTLGSLLGLIGMCLFAGTLPATRLALVGLDPLFITAARAALAGAAALTVLCAAGRQLPPRSLWPELFGAGLCTVLLVPLFAALAMVTLPAAHGGIVLGILPLATVAAAAVFAHERPSLKFWLVSATGAIVVLTFVFRRNGVQTLAGGDVFLLGFVIAGAIGYALSGRLAMRMPGWEVISWQVVIFLPLAATATFVLRPADVADVPVSSWMSLGYVGFVSQYLAFFVFNAALRMAGIARIGQIMLLQPFVIVALALPVNGEAIDFETIFFATAVVTTVLIGQRMRVVRR